MSQPSVPPDDPSQAAATRRGRGSGLLIIFIVVYLDFLLLHALSPRTAAMTRLGPWDLSPWGLNLSLLFGGLVLVASIGLGLIHLHRARR